MEQAKFLLEKDERAPFTSIEKDGLILFTGPHNGHAVPRCLLPCLGMGRDWFSRAHEACDLHVQALFERLQVAFPTASFLSGNYSRLIADLNRVPKHAVQDTSSELPDLKIVQNTPEECCEGQKEQRLDKIYKPYHAEQKRLIDDIRAKHNGNVIVLEIHSFTPIWQSEPRDVEIGTLRCEKTPFSRIFEAGLREQTRYNFISGEPYRAEERNTNMARHMRKEHDLQYLGLEIRNDLIANSQGLDDMTKFIKESLDYVEKSDAFSQAIAPLSLIKV